MNKRAFLILLFVLLSSFCVFASDGKEINANEKKEDPYLAMGYIPSNAIGQERSETESGYYIDRVDENKWYLLKDGNTVKTYIVTKDGKYTIRTETDESGNTEIYKYDDRGNLVSYKDQEGNEETLVYDNSLHLVSSVLIKDNTILNEKTYYRNPQTGALLAIRDNDRFSFFSSSLNSELFVVGNDEDFDTYETFFGSVTYRMAKDENNNTFSAVENDDGELTITHAGGKTIYSKNGRIKEDNGIKYFYFDNGILNYTERTENNTIVKEYYQDASLIAREELNNDEELQRRYTYSSDEIKLELYERGKAYAIVTYAGDGVRVLDVRYL